MQIKRVSSADQILNLVNSGTYSAVIVKKINPDATSIKGLSITMGYCSCMNGEITLSSNYCFVT